jgi:hypothetical protein
MYNCIFHPPNPGEIAMNKIILTASVIGAMLFIFTPAAATAAIPPVQEYGATQRLAALLPSQGETEKAKERCVGLSCGQKDVFVQTASLLPTWSRHALCFVTPKALICRSCYQ